jgi:hypothetical protein
MRPPRLESSPSPPTAQTMPSHQSAESQSRAASMDDIKTRGSRCVLWLARAEANRSRREILNETTGATREKTKRWNQISRLGILFGSKVESFCRHPPVIHRSHFAAQPLAHGLCVAARRPRPGSQVTRGATGSMSGDGTVYALTQTVRPHTIRAACARDIPIPPRPSPPIHLPLLPHRRRPQTSTPSPATATGSGTETGTGAGPGTGQSP